jgi:hypothetical protein
MPDLRSRFRGCLLGDALGAPVEFMSLAQILERYGPDGIANMDEAYGRVGAITDDTQMTLFTAEGLLRARNREMSRGIPSANVAIVRDSYLRWLHTQGVPPRKEFRSGLEGRSRGLAAGPARAIFPARSRQHLHQRATTHGGRWPGGAQPQQGTRRGDARGAGGDVHARIVMRQRSQVRRDLPPRDGAGGHHARPSHGETCERRARGADPEPPPGRGIAVCTRARRRGRA